MSLYYVGDAVCIDGDLNVTGRVRYVRMKPPSYTTEEAVCVILDSKKNSPGYDGTIYEAHRVGHTDECNEPLATKD